MKKFDYKTVFHWKDKKLYIFYKYHTGLYIPADLNFFHYKRKYSTASLMSLLSHLYDQRKFPTVVHSKDYWLDSNNKTRFVEFCKSI